MKRKVLFSFLGTGDYVTCDYSFKGEIASSRFVQEVIIKNLCKEWSQDDQILFGLTDEARNGHWNSELKETLEVLPLSARLGTFLVDPIEDESDLWPLFLKMFEYLKEGDEVYLDITHSFRFQPMLFMVLLNYAKALRQISVGGIYYGLYDRNLEGPFKVMDLSAFSLIQDWSKAAANFKEFGLADSFLQLSKEIDLPDSDSDASDALARFQKSLYSWSINSQTIRGDILKDNKTVKSLRENAQRISSHPIAPLGILAEEVVKDLSHFPQKNGIEQLEALLLWYREKGRIVEGFTLLSELLVERVMAQHMVELNKFIEDFPKGNLNKRDRNNLKRPRHFLYRHIKLVFQKFKYEKESLKIVESFRLPYHVKIEIPRLSEVIIEHLSVEITHLEVYAYLEDSVSDLRNDINHAGLIDNPKKPEAFIKSFGLLVDKYFNIPD
jgi:CRISPR-associated Csx2 family protein